MAKRKPGRFSATKAVKANDDEPRTGRRAKHKPNLQEVIERGE
jgi:hypothetical protein